MFGQKTTKDKVIFLSVLLLAVTFLIRLIDQAKLLFQYPGGYVNDLSSYLAQLYFLDACGFHGFCTYWYNGFTAFLITPPGWYFFAYPFYMLFGDVKIAAYLSILLIFVLAFVAVYYFGKVFKIKPLYRVFFFLLVFANANTLRGLLRLGRPHELLSWLLFLLLFFIFVYYKEKDIDWKFYAASLLYAALLITYFSVALFGGLLFAGLFLVKPWKQRLHVCFAAVLAFVLSSFWLLPFLSAVGGTTLLTTTQNTWLLVFTKGVLLKQIGALVLPLAFLAVFYFYWKQKKRKTDLLFYFPFLALCVLLLLRVTAFLPILKNISPNPLFTLFILLAGYLFVQTSFPSKFLQRFTLISLSLLVLASSVLALAFTPYFETFNEDEQDFIELLPHIEERYMLIGMLPKQVYSKAISAYGSIYYDLPFVSGYYLHVTNQAYIDDIAALIGSLPDEDCETFIEKTNEMNIVEAVSHTGCDFLEQCGMHLKLTKNDYCLYTF